ncbi:MAG: aminodeoxychorismate/anthranilate synthase component II [Bacteroidia bacterium]|nr:MAG: aminodeoxychorismate/anthranilate synthase component II [Bacteroidia bacterium]
METKILVIDNYDSFTYNLVNLLYEVGVRNLEVKRNDEISLENIQNFDKILISPGPGLPQEAGITMATILNYASTKSILGVCLGHQSIGEVFHSPLKNLDFPLHGVSSKIKILQEDYLFYNCPKEFLIGHYHSWVIEKLSPELEVLAVDEHNHIMAIRHKTWDVRGVQFHPESILTEYGFQIIFNWVHHQNS